MKNLQQNKLARTALFAALYVLSLFLVVGQFLFSIYTDYKTCSYKRAVYRVAAALGLYIGLCLVIADSSILLIMPILAILACCVQLVYSVTNRRTSTFD